MLYRDKEGKDWVITIGIGVALDVLKVWGINLLELKTPSLSLEDAVKVAAAAVGYDRDFYANLDEGIVAVVNAEILYFYFPPDYEKKETKKKADGDKITFGLIYELAGSVGIDPSPLTLWQLLALVKGAQKRDWATESATLSLLYNINRGKNNKAKTPADFNPTIEAKPKPCIDKFL